MTKQIELTKGKTALIDDDDWPRIRDCKWCALETRRGSGHWYAMASVPGDNRKKLYLHRLIMNAPATLQVDHINGDGLDCRKENMRLCTHAQNLQNRQAVNSNAGYLGVYKTIRGNYQAQCKGNIGYYSTARAAAHARDKVARKLYGEFASLNFPTPELNDKEIAKLRTCSGTARKPPEEKVTEITFVRLTKELKSWVESQIRPEARTMSAVIRQCIEKARAQQGKSKASQTTADN